MFKLVCSIFIFQTMALAGQYSSKYDLKIGNGLTTLFNELKENKLSVKTTKKLKFNIKKSQTFKSFNKVISRSHRIAIYQNNHTFFHRSCGINKRIQSNHPIIIKIDKQLNKFCDNLFIEALEKNKLSLNKRNKEYIKSSLDKLLKLNLKKLHSIVKNKHVKKFIKETIEKNEIDVQNKIASTLGLDKNHHKKISRKKRIANKQYRNVYKKSLALFENGDLKKSIYYSKKLVRIYKRKEHLITKKKAYKYIMAAATRYNLKQPEASEELLDFSEGLVSNEDQKQEVIFYRLWNSINNKKYNKGLQIVHENKLIEDFENLHSRTQFWIAKLYGYKHKTSMAKNLMVRITEANPLSFYGIMASKELSIKNDTKIKLIKNNSPKLTTNNSIITKNKDSFQRLHVWTDIKNERFSLIEARNILAIKEEDKQFRSISSVNDKKTLALELVKILNQKKLYLNSFKLLYKFLDKNVISFNKKTAKFLFPFDYLKKIKKETGNEIDPIFVLSLIRQESAFNPEAKSRVGARGLMQLMPRTAKMYQKKVKNKELKTPDTNIKIGIKLLKNLLKKYDGNIIYTLAAYNAGERRVKEWRRDRFVDGSDPLTLIETIPFKETRNYVKLIYRNMFFYKSLLNDSSLNTPLNETFVVSFTPTAAMFKGK